MTTVFVDLDGVLADFDTGYRLISDKEDYSKESDSVDWKLVEKHGSFFRDLPPMPDFDELWNQVVLFDPIILTGVPHSVPGAPDHKREWVDKYMGKDQPMIACKSRDKSLHMKNKGDILIDDWEKYKHLWIERGGRWITHLSAESSVYELHYLLS